MKSTIRLARPSRRIRCLPTNRYSRSLPLGRVGRLARTLGGTVESGSADGYTSLTLNGNAPGLSSLMAAFVSGPSGPLSSGFRRRLNLA